MEVCVQYSVAQWPNRYSVGDRRPNTSEDEVHSGGRNVWTSYNRTDHGSRVHGETVLLILTVVKV